MRNLLERLARWWRRIPSVLQTIIMVGAAVFVFELLPDFDDMSVGGIVASAAMVGLFALVMFTIAVRESLTEADPVEIVKSAEEGDGDRRGQRRKLVLIAGLACVALGLIWILIEVSDSAGVLREGASKTWMFSYGAALLLAGLAAPALLLPAVFLLGHLLAPVTLRARFSLELGARVDAPLVRRAAIDSIPDLATGLGPAERVDGSDPPQFLFRPTGLMGRLIGLGQIVTIEHLEPGRDLVLSTQTKGGDGEINRYTLQEDAAGGPQIVECEAESRLGSPFTKGLVRIIGVPHLARGAAEVEARRFAKLAGVPVTVAGFQREGG